MTEQFIAFDLETTGLYPIRNKIVEIGAVRFKGKKVIDQFHTLVNPGGPIPQEVIAIHGITDEMVKNAPPERYAVELFLKFIGPDTLIAHNAPFDAGFIMATVAQHKMTIPINTVLDTCVLAKKYLKGVANYKLGTLGRYFNTQETGYHRAMADASVTKEIFLGLLDKLPEGITIENVAYLPEQGLRLQDFVFDKIELPPEKAILNDAVQKGFSVQIEYRNTKGEYSKRRLTPFTMYSFKGKVYLSAYCHQAQEDRQFRVDRLVSVAKI